eukprot:15364933-Ditylum_brightwellii.AAC.2
MAYLQQLAHSLSSGFTSNGKIIHSTEKGFTKSIVITFTSSAKQGRHLIAKFIFFFRVGAFSTTLLKL